MDHDEIVDATTRRSNWAEIRAVWQVLKKYGFGDETETYSREALEWKLPSSVEEALRILIVERDDAQIRAEIAERRVLEMRKPGLRLCGGTGLPSGGLRDRTR